MEISKEQLEKYQERLDEIALWGDSEEGHWEADQILCDILTELGYDKIVASYQQVGKWYA